jgi:hypothetical protein
MAESLKTAGIIAQNDENGIIVIWTFAFSACGLT